MPGITVAAIITTFLISAGLSFVLTVLSRALAPDPKEDATNRGGWRARIFQSKNPLAPRDIVYGEVRKSGTVVYEEVTDDGAFLHTVIVLGTGEVEAIPVVFFDDTPIYDDDIASWGGVIRGKFSVPGKTNESWARISKYLGSDTQSADSHLVSQSDGHWTSSHKLQGICYIYVKLAFNRDIYTTQPAISAYIKGKKINDIRNSSPAAYSTNPALAFRDYVTTEIKDMGVGFDGGDIDDVLLAATANDCDEFVSVSPISYEVVPPPTPSSPPSSPPSSTPTPPFSPSPTPPPTPEGGQPGGGGGGGKGRRGKGSRNGVAYKDAVYLKPKEKAFALQTGDKVTYAGTNRYVVLFRPFLKSRKSNHIIRLATSYNNAVAGIYSTLPGTGATVIKTAEPRYTCSGVIDSSRTPRDNMMDILSAMGGKATYTQGKWKVRAAVYNPPLLEYDKSDIVSKVNAQTKHSLRERFNAVKGQYFSPGNLGVPAEYPQIKNAFYQTEDGGERIFGVLDLPFTSRPHTAQRLAKIKLEEHRQSIVFKSSFNLTALAVQPTDTIFLSIPRMGWDRKVFEIIEWEFVGRNDDKKAPIFTVDMTLKETASGIYDWNMGEETTVDLAPNTNLANPLSAVTGITVEFEVIIGEDGTAYTSMRICWDPHPNPHIAGYSVEYRKVGDANWTPAGFVTAESTCIVVEPVVPGAAYEARVRARNFTGLDSPYGHFTSSGVRGDRIAPGDPINITLDPTPGGYFVMWENPTDLDLDVIEVWERKIP